jgi:hypothetical protein
MRLVASFSKAVNLPVVLGDGGFSGWPLDQAGAPIYSWQTPDGPPDGLMWILSAAYLRQRAQLTQGIAENWWKTGEWDPFSTLPSKPTYLDFLSRWEKPLFNQARPELSNALLISQNIKPNDVVTDPRRARRLIGLLACSPSFQTEVILPSPEQFKSNLPISVSRV